MVRIERAAWLYTQGSESIVITRDVTGLMLLVCGPGAAEHAHTFDSAATLERFLEWYQASLTRDGWSLHRMMDRRQPVRSALSADRRRHS